MATLQAIAMRRALAIERLAVARSRLCGILRLPVTEEKLPPKKHADLVQTMRLEHEAKFLEELQPVVAAIVAGPSVPATPEAEVAPAILKKLRHENAVLRGDLGDAQEKLEEQAAKLTEYQTEIEELKTALASDDSAPEPLDEPDPFSEDDGSTETDAKPSE